MTACKRWVSEGLKHYASYFHGIAWGVPAVAAIIVIALKADFYIFILNSCHHQSTSLTTLPPSSSPSNIPHSISSVRLANHVTKLERLMIRLGFFSVLSTVPAIFVVSWSNEAAKAATSCEPGWNTQRCGPRMSYPPVEVELLKIFMSLIIGVTSGIWVWSPKSIILWKHFFIRCLRLRQRKDIVKSDVNLRKTSSPCSNTARSSPPGYLGTQDCRSPFVSPVYIPHQSNPSSRMHLFVNRPNMREKSHKTESDFSTSFV
ncbi:Frizzled-9 [Armadillidium vulgare]|nr:Frizzled-9 [Armadillidium vulgare]